MIDNVLSLDHLAKDIFNSDPTHISGLSEEELLVLQLPTMSVEKLEINAKNVVYKTIINMPKKPMEVYTEISENVKHVEIDGKPIEMRYTNVNFFEDAECKYKIELETLDTGRPGALLFYEMLMYIADGLMCEILPKKLMDKYKSKFH